MEGGIHNDILNIVILSLCEHVIVCTARMVIGCMFVVFLPVSTILRMYFHACALRPEIWGPERPRILTSPAVPSGATTTFSSLPPLSSTTKLKHGQADRRTGRPADRQAGRQVRAAHLSTFTLLFLFSVSFFFPNTASL